MLTFYDFGGAPTDPHFSSTVLLLSCDGTNGSTTFTDESAAARGNATVQGDAQVSTGAPKFGSGALLCDGTTDSIVYADSADWQFGSGDFTIEGWFYFDSAFLNNNQTLMCQWNTSGNQRSWTFSYRGDLSPDQLQFAGSSAGSSANLAFQGNWTPTANTWYHLAVDRSGNVFRIYIDGTMLATATNSLTLFNSTSGCRISGNDASGAAINFFKGQVDEPRITKGVARYASDSGYTVPTAAFPRS